MGSFKKTRMFRPYGTYSGVRPLSFPGNKLPRYFRVSLTGHLKNYPDYFGRPNLDFVNWIGLSSVKIINRKGTG